MNARLAGEVHPLERAERQHVAAAAGGNSLTRALTSAPFVDQRRDQPQRRRRDRRRSRVAPLSQIEVADVDRRPERRPAPPVGGVRTPRRASTSNCATASWPLVIAISSGVMPLGSARVHVGAGLDQHARGLEPAVARGEQQRRHAAGRRQLLALRRHAAADDADAVRAAAGAGRPDGGLRAPVRVVASIDGAPRRAAASRSRRCSSARPTSAPCDRAAVRPR